MNSRRKVVIGAVVIVALGGSLAVLMHRSKRSIGFLQGAVIRQDAETRKELPIASVQITAANDLSIGVCESDSSGFFKVRLAPGVKWGTSVTLRFRHSEYLPLDLDELAGDKLYVARMLPVPQSTRAESRLETVIANVTARYSIKAMTSVNMGSAVKQFQVINTGNVPCNGRQPCSPDGMWKAAIGSASLDAGEGNEFQNARVSCIAGPCPFTRIESDGFSRPSRAISVSARNWSDTTTFLLEAEVFHPMVSDNVRKSTPVIFDRALNFTLPATAQGVSIQAEVNGETIIFPLGPNLFLSWADCNVRGNSDQTRLYRCELKPGYRFP